MEIENFMSIPKAYQNGYIEFYKLKFKVTPDVLIPRPETELLVDEVLQFIGQLPNTNFQMQPLTILDLGTGSGAIAISLAKNLKNLPSCLTTSGVAAQIIATDISPKALKIAQQNAKVHRVEDNITFIQSDLLNVITRTRQGGDEAISKIRLPRPFGARNDSNIDIVVTNLPYIPTSRIPYLDSSVKDFEPHVALDGGEDGFELYRKLFQQISGFIRTPPGWQAKNMQHRELHKWKPKLIVCEIDYTHGELAALEAQKYFPEAEIEVKKDLAKKQRILLIKQRLTS